MEKRRGERDGRTVLIDLTSAGHEFTRAQQRSLNARNRDMLAALGDADQLLLLSSLENLLELVGKAFRPTPEADEGSRKGPGEGSNSELDLEEEPT